ncbi:MAG: hypothetical protein A3I77_03135 [Gammaproteobacteria bacterium RIFCSPLOWO2_02_FULL_42_14]|nr:MAG: hypothetical protein A2624_01405 [Gammaproteobacteria bacterium RIFCSPHIGHO2_01_FULL_42_8]OGT51666.1 MAG: hypothetical protein A3E54_03330 [Gammaproteobacteria bacterium RIFCSPHIGHO2_12_FULL_41_25]OGT61564.1 MAG: hypothetical protein A3I77_03135 [Gammaproteobacteria bacterium RIFCSPLOWO2_02_FULL_42_14]OGT86187.1 MAG: hypothetical protein A3G86_05985 [Gammaproteobacteria bacterium RIFCSPLOWO2_12_FULL_42_18]
MVSSIMDRLEWNTLVPSIANQWRYFQSRFKEPGDVYGALLGIDFDDTSLLTIRLRSTLGALRITNIDAALLPPNTITEGRIISQAQLTTAMQQMLQRTKESLRNAAIAISGSKVVIKEVPIDMVLDDDAVEVRAWHEAHKAFPELAKNLFLDYVQMAYGEEGVKRYMLVIVIARKEDVMPRLDALKGAGLITRTVDVNYYAIERVYPLIAPQLPAGHEEKYVACMHFNPHSLTLVVMHQRKGIYYNRQLYTDDALTSIVKQYIAGDGTSANTLTEEQKSQAALSIHRLLQLFYSEHSGFTIECVAMMGRCALIPDLMTSVEKTLGMSVVVVNPLEKLSFDSRLDANRYLKLGPAFAVSCGLAMRGTPL